MFDEDNDVEIYEIEIPNADDLLAAEADGYHSGVLDALALVDKLLDWVGRGNNPRGQDVQKLHKDLSALIDD